MTSALTDLSVLEPLRRHGVPLRVRLAAVHGLASPGAHPRHPGAREADGGVGHRRLGPREAPRDGAGLGVECTGHSVPRRVIAALWLSWRLHLCFPEAGGPAGLAGGEAGSSLAEVGGDQSQQPGCRGLGSALSAGAEGLINSVVFLVNIHCFVIIFFIFLRLIIILESFLCCECL